MASKAIKTRVLIVSDTHGDQFSAATQPNVDVAIHCGDLTEESKLYEMEAALANLKEIQAPLKLVIAGNHDLTLDVPLFRRKLEDSPSELDPDQVRKAYGDFGEARMLFDAAKSEGIVFLDEGTHRFRLANGALLTVYASPYTPSSSADWAFQYAQQQEHEWDIEEGTDVVMTHGPPRGVFDYTESRQRAGSTSLFEAVARIRPRLHCFGHIHEGWGGKLVAWRDQVSEIPSHLTDIDNGKSVAFETLATLKLGKFDTEEVVEKKARKAQAYAEKGFCHGAAAPFSSTGHTLFVNASIQGPHEGVLQLPWMVDLELPQAPLFDGEGPQEFRFSTATP